MRYGSMWIGNDTNSISDLALYLEEHNAHPNLYNIIDHNTIWIDAKMTAILYRSKNQGILERFRPVNEDQLPYDSLEWLQREGDEHYFYYDTSEFLTFLLQLSDYYFSLIGKENYVLAPISAEAIYSFPRELYQETLQRDMQQFDMHGEDQDFVTGKTVIHLKIMPREDAIEILKTLIYNQPEKYRSLSRVIKQKERYDF